MKITKRQLKRIIKEEMKRSALMVETVFPGEESDDPRIVEMRTIVSKLGELEFHKPEAARGIQSHVDNAVKNLSKVVEEILYQREIGNVQ